MTSTVTETVKRSTEDRQIAEKKRLALSCLTEAWDSATSEGVDPEIFSHAALFMALAELIEIYGEDAVADLASSLPSKIRAFQFSVQRSVQ